MDSSLADTEFARAAQFTDSRRIEWLTGRVLARRAVADVLGCDPSEVIIDVTDAGAPHVVGETEVRVSISHTRDLVVAGAVRGPWLGVDVEWANRDVNRLMRALEPSERAMVEPADVVSVLVAKEAAAKSWGVGLGGSLGRWPVESIDAGEIVVGSPSGESRGVQVFERNGAVVGVCAEGNPGVSVSD
jgi:4'-phosphopantetheinyl transferase